MAYEVLLILWMDEASTTVRVFLKIIPEGKEMFQHHQAEHLWLWKECKNFFADTAKYPRQVFIFEPLHHAMLYPPNQTFFSLLWTLPSSFQKFLWESFYFGYFQKVGTFLVCSPFRNFCQNTKDSNLKLVIRIKRHFFSSHLFNKTFCHNGNVNICSIQYGGH